MFTKIKYKVGKNSGYSRVIVPKGLLKLILDFRWGIIRREEYEDISENLQDKIIEEWVGNSKHVIYKWYHGPGLTIKPHKGVRNLEDSPDKIVEQIIAHSRLYGRIYGGIMLEDKKGKKTITIYGANLFPFYEYRRI